MRERNVPMASLLSDLMDEFPKCRDELRRAAELDAPERYRPEPVVVKPRRRYPDAAHRNGKPVRYKVNPDA